MNQLERLKLSHKIAKKLSEHCSKDKGLSAKVEIQNSLPMEEERKYACIDFSVCMGESQLVLEAYIYQTKDQSEIVSLEPVPLEPSTEESLVPLIECYQKKIEELELPENEATFFTSTTPQEQFVIARTALRDTLHGLVDSFKVEVFQQAYPSKVA